MRFSIESSGKSATIALSDIFTALDPLTVGTKIIKPVSFFQAITSAVLTHDFSQDRIPGQGLIHCPAAVPFVSGGVGRNINNPAAYVLRSYRGSVHAYLKREFAEKVLDCNLIVYTLDAYLKDPDVSSEELTRIKDLAPDLVLVAVLATADGYKSVLSPHRFVQNLAGGNNEALVWTADEIRSKAVDIANYVNEWSTVSD